MEMQKEEFEKLFQGYIQNTLSETELSRLMHMMIADEHDHLIKEEIDSLFQQSNTDYVIDEKESAQILSRILSHSADQPKLITLEQKNKKNKKILRFASAAAVIFLMALGSVVFYKGQSSLESAKGNENTFSKKDLLVFTGKQVVYLPDGSTIVLNDNSRVTYDQNDFNKKTREVTLFGEAYFDVKRNEKIPFIVHTGKVNTKVLGTAFNISAWQGSDIKVTVERGRVQVGDSEKIYGVITPDQQIVVEKNAKTFEQNKVKAETVLAWKSKYLILDDLNMEEAAIMISQKYKVPITLSNDAIKKCRITASFLNDEDLDHVLKVICSVIETKYHYTPEGRVVLEGKGCD